MRVVSLVPKVSLLSYFFSASRSNGRERKSYTGNEVGVFDHFYFVESLKEERQQPLWRAFPGIANKNHWHLISADAGGSINNCVFVNWELTHKSC